jgi:hypothetical protein
MKRVFLVIILGLLCADVFLAQSINISAKKVIYRRTEPKNSDWRRQFEVTYPIITSRLNPTTKKSLEKSLSYWRVFHTSFKELLEENWTTNLSYKILYNQNYLLSISFTMEGVAAYPDSSTEHLVINLKTGKQVGIKDIFKNNSLPPLLTKIRRAIRLMENHTRKESSCFADEIDLNREVYPEFHPLPEKIKYKDLSGFFVSGKGVTFLYDYKFPHRTEACEPEKEYFFSWKELKPFIKPGGLLAQFVR